MYAFAVVNKIKTKEIKFENMFYPDKCLCILAGKSHRTFLRG